LVGVDPVLRDDVVLRLGVRVGVGLLFPVGGGRGAGVEVTMSSVLVVSSGGGASSGNAQTNVVSSGSVGKQLVSQHSKN